MSTTADPGLYPLTLFYDAACPVCALEMDHLRERNADGRLLFVDINTPGFDAGRYGTSYAAMDAQIHGLRADGELIHGVQVLRLAYEAVGLGWLWAPVRWGPIAPVADFAYRVFARHRQAISRTTAPLIDGLRRLRAGRMNRRMAACQGGACEVHRPQER